MNAKIRYDETVLIIASFEGRLKTAKYLVEHGADVNTHYIDNKHNSIT